MPHYFKYSNFLKGFFTFLIIFTLFTPAATNASTLTSAEEQQLAALSLQLNLLSRLLEALKNSFINTVQAQPIAPMNVNLAWLKGGSSPPTGQYSLTDYFQYSGSVLGLNSFKLYLKRPGQSSFSAVATLANPSSQIVTSGCSPTVSSGGWNSRYCANTGNWSIGESVKDPSYYASGDYEAYVTAVDTAGIEGPSSSTLKTTLLGQAVILSPSGVQTSLTPTFRWSVAVGWPSNAIYWPSVWVSSAPGSWSSVWSSSVSISPGTTEGLVVYSGPALDPSKTYYAHVWGEGGSYFSMGDSVPTFTISVPDTTSPSTPTGLAASVISSSQINLSWTASTDSVGVTGYKIYRSGTQIATVITGTSYSDTGLLAGTSYSYTIAAYDAAGNVSSQSSSVSVTTSSANAPAAPSNFTATVSGANVNFTWTDNANNESGFSILRQNPNGTSYSFGIGMNAQSAVDSNLAGGTYTYTIMAYNSYGNSGWSASVSATVSGDTSIPSTPIGLAATVISSSQINLAWSASTDNVGVTGYKIYRGGTQIATASTTAYSDTGLSASTAYSYTVAAYDAAGNVSSQSSSVSATTLTSTTLTVPAKPSIFTAYASGSNVSLYWEGNYPYPTPESEAKVYRRLQGSSSWTQIYSKSYNPAYINYDRYTDAGLANATYEYHINICNSGGCSVDSNTATVTVGGSTTTTTSAPISYWKFDGNGNNDVVGGPSAFIVGNAVFNSSGGKSGGYLYIPTGADLAKIPYNSMFDLPGPFTIEFWFRQRTNRSFLQDLVYKGNGINNYNFRIFRQLWDQNNFGPVMMGSTALNTGFWSSPTNGNQLSHGSWHHVAYTRNSSEAVSYLDGTLLYSLNFAWYPEYSGPVKTPAVDIIIGDSAVDTDIDELKIYNRALGASEVSQDAGITTTVPPPSPTPPPPPPPPTTATTTTATTTTATPPTTTPTTPITTTGVPAAPSNFNASVSGQNVTLTWNDNSTNEAGFEAYRRPAGGSYSSWILLPLSYTANNTAIGSYIDNNVSTGSYDYTISACNSYGCSSGIFVYSVNVGTIYAVTATATTTTLTPASPVIDTIPPAGIFNLTASGAASNSISLNWTAPGDDGNSGTASSYLVRYATSQISSENMWQSSTPVTSGIPLPQLAGTSQSMTVFGLQSGTVYYFALKTTDKAGNISPLSGSPWGMTQASSSYSVYSYTAHSRAIFTPGQQQIQAPPPFIREQTAVEITVLDSTDQPVPNIGIHIFKENFSANFGGTTDAKGLFQVSIPQGLYLAEVFSPVNRLDLVRPAPFIFIVSKEETKKITLRFIPASKVVIGTVLFPDGRPVSGAEVIAYSTITKQWISAVVDVNGKYELKLGGGTWQLGVRPKDEGKAKWTWQGPIEEVNFQDNSQQEFKTLNFTIPFANSNLSVKTVDEKGDVITQAGVVVDTMSAARTAESKIHAQFRKSEERGIAEFSLEGGSYYVRGFVSQESGYLNPAEEVVVLAAGERKEVTLVFKKREITLTVNISGIVKLSTGVKSNAFIWAWSEKGRFAQTRADEEGGFILQVARDDRWHLGAGKELDGTPYKSTEITVVVEKSPVVIEMALVKLKEEVLPPPVIVTQQNTQSLVAQSQDGAKVELQANAVSTAGAVTVEVKPTVEAPSQAGARVVSTVYDVEVKDAKGQEVKELQNEVEISLPYDEKDLKAQGVKEDQITPSFFDESVGSWVKVEKYTIDKKNKVVIAKVKHLTRFALVAAADVTPPLPPTNVFPVAKKDGATRLTWKNPTKDFSNAKLYRSEKQGELGAVISAEVSGAEFTDSNTIEGRTYYYTVRAVDPAGNESANVVQTVVKAIATGAKSKAGAVKIQAGVGINRNLSLRDKGEDVKLLQKFLCNAKFYPECLITGVLETLTRQAVIGFQEYYGSEILVPAGLSKGNGFVGPGTRKKINELLGKLKNY